MVVSDATFQRISIKHSGFNPDSVIEASFKVLHAVPDIMNKVPAAASTVAGCPRAGQSRASMRI
jgi:hypothetical protein